MREILFRGKRKDNGEWIQGDLLHDRFISSNEKIWRIYNEESKLTHREDVVIPETVGQYTGLTDKNGTKIFEGDVVKANAYDEDISPCVCFWDDCNFEFGFKNDIEDFGIAFASNIEVIGNIHDNPELLKGGAE